MSRRHKIQENNNNEPHKAESQAGGRQKKILSLFSGVGIINKVLTSGVSNLVEKISSAVCEAFEMKEVVVDDEYVKIPLKYFETAFESPPDDDFGEVLANGRGRRPIKSMFKKFSDSKLVGYFKKTYLAAKKKCKELLDGMTQFAVCFLEGSHEAFAPDDDPYGKVSHYHEILVEEVEGIPAVRTLNHYLNWFVDWKPRSVVAEDKKDVREKVKHRLWEKLIKWICNYLKEIAPQYAFAVT